MNLWIRPNFYDLLKTIAILLMIIDHIWYFFFPEEIMWRIIGRISMPLFLFLVGYNRSGTLPLSLIISAIVADAAMWIYNTSIGYSIVWSILWSILIIKIIHRSVLSYTWKSKWVIWWGLLLSIILLFFNTLFMPILDYGTLAISIWLCWLILWHSHSTQEKIISYLTLFIVMMMYFLQQIKTFHIYDHLSILYWLAIIRGWCIVVLPIIKTTYKGIFGKTILRCSKYSLRIYSWHIIVFACISYLL